MNPQDEIQRLSGPFPGLKEQLFTRLEHIPSASTAAPYLGLLVHQHHMTVTMEEFYGTPVEVHVLAEHREGDIYSREILLTRSDNQYVIQYGLVRLDLSLIEPAVSEEILAGREPLGRVLIRHNVLRQLDLTAIIRLQPGPRLRELLGCTAKTTLFGRFATIFCSERPAVHVLEIPAPVIEST